MYCCKTLAHNLFIHKLVYSFKFKDLSRLPNNKILEKARLDTYGAKQKWWSHDSVKNHGATSRKVYSFLSNSLIFVKRLYLDGKSGVCLYTSEAR